MINLKDMFENARVNGLELLIRSDMDKGYFCSVNDGKKVVFKEYFKKMSTALKHANEFIDTYTRNVGV